jgi:hypothetical protein
VEVAVLVVEIIQIMEQVEQLLAVAALVEIQAQ